jgi:hypothetical protein
MLRSVVPVYPVYPTTWSNSYSALQPSVCCIKYLMKKAQMKLTRVVHHFHLDSYNIELSDPHVVLECLD